jgi:Ca-activated chloride channel family protein
MERESNMKIYYFVAMMIFTCNVNAAFYDVLLNEDRQGYNSYQNSEYNKAYNKFNDIHWKGIAALKDKNYDGAIDHLSMIDSIDAKYNLGNAYALKGDFDNAINTYEDVLKSDPYHVDAKYNLEVVKKLKDQMQNNQSQDNKDSKDKNKSSKDGNQNNQDKKSQDNKEQENKDKQEQSEDKQNKDKQKNNNENKGEKQDQQNKQQRQAEQNKPEDKSEQKNQQPQSSEKSQYDEKSQADEQWLRSIPDDPGGLLRQKFLRDHLNRRGN